LNVFDKLIQLQLLSRWY